MHYHSKVEKLTVGDNKMISFLNGGLSLGRLSYWTAMIHEFRTGTMINLIVSAAANNRPSGSTHNKALYINSEMGLSDALHWFIRIIADQSSAPKQMEGENPMAYVVRAFAGWGWELHVARTESLDAADLDSIIKSVDYDGDKLRLICVDGIERFQGPGFVTGKISDYLTSLKAVVPNRCHLAVTRLLGQHAAWLRRTLKDQYLFLTVAGRTGYVPKFSAELNPEHSVVFGVIREAGRQPHVMYRHANENFEKGFVNMVLGQNGSSWPSYVF